MRLSVVVPLLNEVGQLPDLIQHLRELRPGGEAASLEVVLVDGGSSDGTRLCLERSGQRWIAAPRGRSHQLNAGAAATSGDCLVFLHADTRLPAGALAAIHDACRNGAVGGFFGVRLDGNGWHGRMIGALINLRSRLSRISTGDQVQWFRRDAFEAIGGFAPVPLFEDLDIARRLRRHGRVVPLPLLAVTSARRWRRQGVWPTIVRMWGLRLAWWLGVPPTRLAHHYEDVR